MNYGLNDRLQDNSIIIRECTKSYSYFNGEQFTEINSQTLILFSNQFNYTYDKYVNMALPNMMRKNFHIIIL